MAGRGTLDPAMRVQILPPQLEVHMIRYHKTSNYPGLLVTSRRKPRGYVMKVTEVRRVYRGDYRSMETTWEAFDGWKAVGLNGYTDNSIYDTRKRATEVLLSNHNFWIGNPSPRFERIRFMPAVNSNLPVVLGR